MKNISYALQSSLARILTTGEDRRFATMKAIIRNCPPYLFKANWSQLLFKVNYNQLKSQLCASHISTLLLYPDFINRGFPFLISLIVFICLKVRCTSPLSNNTKKMISCQTKVFKLGYLIQRVYKHTPLTQIGAFSHLPIVCPLVCPVCRDSHLNAANTPYIAPSGMPICCHNII